MTDRWKWNKYGEVIVGRYSGEFEQETVAMVNWDRWCDGDSIEEDEESGNGWNGGRVRCDYRR